MMPRIDLANFKCFGEKGLCLDLAPLTFLVGRNGAGKSSILEAIALLVQTAQQQAQRNGFAWQGKWANLGGDGSLAFHKKRLDSKLRLGATVAVGNALTEWRPNLTYGDQLSYRPGFVTYVVEHTPQTYEWSHEFFFDDSLAAKFQTLLSHERLGISHKNVVSYPLLPDLNLVTHNSSESPSNVFWPQLFNSSTAQSIDSTNSAKLEILRRELSLYLEFMGHLMKTRVFYVGASRFAKPAQMGLPAGPRSVGKNGEQCVALLAKLFAEPENEETSEAIRTWARVFGMDKLGSGWTGEEQLQGAYMDAPLRVGFPINAAGFGSQQILPVITQLFAAPRGSLVLVEEPEVSLHPEAQINLASMFADALNRGNQIVVTSHSPLLIEALPLAGREYGLRSSDVAVYHFERDNDEVCVKRLDADGSQGVREVPSFASAARRLCTTESASA